MTRFEKIKRDLTINDLVMLANRADCCCCLVNSICESSDNESCISILHNYFNEEVESEVENEQFKQL